MQERTAIKPHKPRLVDNARREKIRDLHNNGMTFDAIGRIFGISRQRVHKIYQDFTGNDSSPRRNLKAERGAEIRKMKSEGKTTKQIADKLGVTTHTVNNVLRKERTL